MTNKGSLGSGAFGFVEKMNFHVYTLAVKEMAIIDDNKIDVTKRVLMDLEVIRKSNECPYIVKCFGYILTEGKETLNICMELMASCLEKTLKSLGCGFPEKIIGKITVNVVTALNYLKETHKIIHRDVKPSNMLIDWFGRIKLCDFGIAGNLIDSKPVSMTWGSVLYLAPERIAGQPYDVRADVWSLGISLVYLTRGIFPYEPGRQEKLDVLGMIQCIKEHPPPLLNPKECGGITDQFCEFIERCLQKNSEMRPKYKEIFAHPFFMQSQEDKTDVGAWYSSFQEEIE